MEHIHDAMTVLALTSIPICQSFSRAVLSFTIHAIWVEGRRAVILDSNGLRFHGLSSIVSSRDIGAISFH